MNYALYKFGRAICRTIITVFGGMTVIGRENIPETGGVIICGNHVSYMDPPVLGSAANRPVRFMAKSELFEIPVLGKLIYWVRAFPVKRGTADRNALKKAMEIVNSGDVVAMFPEGRRSLDGNLLEPEAGAGLIVMRTDAVIIPCALIDTEKMLPPHSPFLHFARVTAVFGKPVDISDLKQAGGRTSVDEASKRIMSAIGALKEEFKKKQDDHLPQQ